MAQEPMQPDVLYPILGFLGLCVICSWAVFRATDRRSKR